MRRLYFIFSILVCLFISASGYSSNAILKGLDGKTIPFDSLKGKWVLINYWASWCQPCVDEIGELNRFYKKSGDKVALFAVNNDGVPAHSQAALVKKFKIQYPSLRDPARELGLGSIHGVPVTFVFTPEGKFKGKLYGEQTLRSLNKATS